MSWLGSVNLKGEEKCGSLADIRVAAGNLTDYPDIESAVRERFVGIDIIAAAQRRIEEQLGLPSKTEAIDDEPWLRAKSFSLIFSICCLAYRLIEHYQIEELRFRLQPFGQLGDAVATSEVFLKMLPLLKQVGITTLRQALGASQKTSRAPTEARFP